jgi:hypothetical protein
MNKNYWKGKAFSVGYKPSKKDHDVFYRRSNGIVFFLIFKYRFKSSLYRLDNKIVKVFKFPSGFKVLDELEQWQIARALKEEQQYLRRIRFVVRHGSWDADGYFWETSTYLDGYCKICSKDIQCSSLLCKDCTKKQKKLFIEYIKHYIAKNINETRACYICGRKLSLSIDSLFCGFRSDTYRKYYLEHDDDLYYIKQKLKKSFKLYQPQKFLINHHLCYYDEFTIDVCPTCHARIHHSKDESYAQYRPVDSRSFLNMNKECDKI